MTRVSRRLVESEEDPAIKHRIAWNAIMVKRSSSALDTLREGDVGDGERVSAWEEPERFAELGGEIGRKFCASMDGRASMPAFGAWCDVFMDRYETLRGRDGHWWSLDELTFDIFQEVLKSMPSGKAVGSGGMTIELLRIAGEEAQQLFYEVMMQDVKGLRIPEHWRRILYVLLTKPLPNNPELVHQRREIALMAVDMKFFLHMVRRTAHSRIAGRIDKAQMGGCAGYGCADVSLALECALQQNRRLQGEVWVLYVDLATWFPSIDRRASRFSDMVTGLPASVIEVVSLIYGKHGDYDGAVKCQYDSAIGLLGEFPNFMGRLMGCVLSPDEAKILLNTCIVAIEQVARGYRCFGSVEVDGAWRRVLNLLYADDWCGVCESQAEMERAWDCWRLWEPISGSRVGVLAKKKTVLSAARFVRGRWVTPRDPKLTTGRGVPVVMIGLDEAYKHLGVWRRADGIGTTARVKIEERFRPALRRLGRLRKPTRDEFNVCSEGLLCSLGGFYFQTAYASFEATEKVEAKWRRLLNRNFRRSWSTPRAELYGQPEEGPGGVKGVARTHLAAVAMAALVATMCKAMADVAPTAQQVAARSSLALAYSRLGCSQDPNHWSAAHLTQVLGERLRLAKVKDLGDAFIYIISVLEAVTFEETTVEAWKDEQERQRREIHGRFIVNFERRQGDPLWPGAEHFRASRSPLLFEPVENGGLGLQPELELLECGVKALGHLCKPPLLFTAQEGEWIEASEAGLRNPRWIDTKCARAAWGRVVAELRRCGIQPVRPEKVGDGGVRGGALERRAANRTGRDVAKIEAALSDLRAEAEGGEVGTRAQWKRRLQACITGVVPAPAREWHTGNRDVAAQARECRLVVVADDERRNREEGGEAKWLARADVGEDGYLRGWEEEAEMLMRVSRWDDEGYFVDEGEVDRLTVEDLAEWPPMLQLMIRARIAVGECPVFAKYQGKQKERTINLEVTSWNAAEASIWQARMGITVALATDGSWEEGKEAAWGVVRHDGTVRRSLMEVWEGKDNYLAELAALVEALAQEADGERISIVFDATSPVLALLHFRRAHDRTKQQFYGSDLLDSFDQEVARMDVVVLLWQRSHVGSPANEWVDGVADCKGFDKESDPMLQIRRRTPRHYSMRLAAPDRSVMRWAKGRAVEVVQRQLMQSVTSTQFREMGELRVGPLPDQYELVAKACAASRRCPGDRRYFWNSTMAELARVCGCPFGCERKVVSEKERREVGGDTVPIPFTWTHLQFWCCGSAEIEEARAEWLMGTMAERAQGDGLGHGLYGLKHALELPIKGQSKGVGHHQQVADLIKHAEYGVQARRGTRTRQERMVMAVADFPASEWGGRAMPMEVENCWRGVAKMWKTTGNESRDNDRGLIKQVRDVTMSGLRVQMLGDKLTAAWRKELAGVRETMQAQRPWARKWYASVMAAGPLAVAEWGKLEGLVDGALQVLNTARLARTVTPQQYKGALKRLQVARRERHSEIRGERGTRTKDGEHVQAVVWWLLAVRFGQWIAKRRRRGAGHAAAVGPAAIGTVIVSTRISDGVRVRLLAQRVLPGVGLEGLRGGASWACVGGWTAAFRKYVRAGGAAAVRTAATELRADRARREVAAQSGGFLRHFIRSLEHTPVREGVAGGGGARVSPCVGSSMSGAPLAPVGAKYVWTRVDLRRRDKSTVRKVARERHRKRAKEKVVRELRRGMAPDDSERWAVEDIVDVRREAGRGGRILALVRWAGADAAGEPWEDDWVGLSLLTPDLKAEVRRRLAARKAPAAARRPQGWRRSPRLAEHESAAVATSEEESEGGETSGSGQDESEGSSAYEDSASASEGSLMSEEEESEEEASAQGAGRAAVRSGGAAETEVEGFNERAERAWHLGAQRAAEASGPVGDELVGERICVLAAAAFRWVAATVVGFDLESGAHEVTHDGETRSVWFILRRERWLRASLFGNAFPSAPGLRRKRRGGEAAARRTAGYCSSDEDMTLAELLARGDAEEPVEGVESGAEPASCAGAATAGDKRGRAGERAAPAEEEEGGGSEAGGSVSSGYARGRECPICCSYMAVVERHGKVLRCDGVCGEDILRNVRRMACALCDYDYCMRCAGGEEALLRRLPGSDAIFGANEHVYAAYTWANGVRMVGLFARRRLRKNTLLGEYTGEVLTREQADELEGPPNQYLMDALRVGGGGDMVVIDGTPEKGNLMGYANYAASGAANAAFQDDAIIDARRAPAGMVTCVRVVTTEEVGEGVEVRIDYDMGRAGTSAPFYDMMVNVLGIDKGALNSANYKANVWATPRASRTQAEP